MAWRSSGTSNDEMVSNLKRFGVISSPQVEQALRSVDRRFFVPRGQRHLAHTDQPLREGNVHISAPHMYGSVLEALELPPPTDSGASFLNIGSGTGYLSCVVAALLGPASTHHGVELHADVLQHAHQAMAEWRDAREMREDNHDGAVALPPISLVHGNGLDISTEDGEGAVGFDRIYIGATVGKQHLPRLAQLLKTGGILVGPVDDELVKVHRISRTDSTTAGPVPRSIHGHQPTLSSDFSLQIISSVRFYPLSESPRVPVVLPVRIWSPDQHLSYPNSFKRATQQLLLCSRSSEVQPVAITVRQNVASKLPSSLWLEILSYARHDWFEQPIPEEALLRKRLQEERTQHQRSQERMLELEARVRALEQECNGYRLMVARLRRSLQAHSTGEDMSEGIGAGHDGGAVPSVRSSANHPFLLRLAGLAAGTNVHVHIQPSVRNESDSDDDDSEDEHADEEMDDFSEMSAETEVLDDARDESVTMFARPQVRSVSISTDDT